MVYQKGHIPSVETREKLSRALTGRKLPLSQRRKMSKSLRGHTVSSETREKLRSIHTKHGEGVVGHTTYEYQLWVKIRSEHKRRGVAIAAEWETYEGFLQDIGRRPSLDVVFGRKDLSKKHERGNCFWTTPLSQIQKANNSLVHKGETAVQASKRLGGSRYLVGFRLKAGWPIEKAFTTPLGVALQ